MAGCGGGTDVVGKYKLQMPPGGKPMPMEVTLELKADKTFDMMFFTGTYEVSGDTVQMTPTKMMGQPVKPEDVKEKITFKIEDGGKSLIPQATGKAMPAEMAGAKFVKQ
jgi:hypothetical protein